MSGRPPLRDASKSAGLGHSMTCSHLVGATTWACLHLPVVVTLGTLRSRLSTRGQINCSNHNLSNDRLVSGAMVAKPSRHINQESWCCSQLATLAGWQATVEKIPACCLDRVCNR